VVLTLTGAASCRVRDQPTGQERSEPASPNSILPGSRITEKFGFLVVLEDKHSVDGARGPKRPGVLRKCSPILKYGTYTQPSSWPKN
jgi:hypothetical protein